MLASVRARDGARLVPIDDAEHALLIRTGRTVSSRFGSGGVALVAGDCPWALPLLAEWRGLAFNEGAGI